MSQYPNELLILISYLKKLPGVGSKTAERFAFILLEWSKNDLTKFSEKLATLKEKIYPCSICGCLKDTSDCTFCTDRRRDPSLLCLVSSPKDVYAIEETRAFRGAYHVIGGLLSPLDGRTIEQKVLKKIEERLTANQVKEVIIALDSTLEGDATALFLKQKLNEFEISTTRLAFGLPMGSSLDYVDYGTLEKAFTGRRIF